MEDGGWLGEYPNVERLAGKLEAGRWVIFKDCELMVNGPDAPIEFEREKGGIMRMRPGDFAELLYFRLPPGGVD